MARGQVVSGLCIHGKVEEVKEALLNVKDLSLPVTHEIEVIHGGYGARSRFDVMQLKYAGGGHGGCGGYFEILDIKNPPDGRCGVIIDEFDVEKGFRFHEFDSVEHALMAWKEHFGAFASADGCIRTVTCGKLAPWFYAVATQALWKDFAFPSRLGDDPVYRPGVEFVVKDRDTGIRVIKTCMGMNWESRGEEKCRVVWWDDGTTSKGSELEHIRPLRGQKLWQFEAGKMFDRLLKEEIETMRILTPDGKVITVSVGEAAPNQCLTLDSTQQTLWGEAKPEALIKAKGKRKMKRWRGKGKWPVVAVETTVLAGTSMSLKSEEEILSDKLIARESSRR